MISKLHYITQNLPGKDHDQLTKEACDAGVDWVQVRVKNREETQKRKLIEKVRKITERYRVTLIVDDDVELAKDIKAEGVHLGKEDMPVEKARRMLGDGFIIGGTANTFEDIQALSNTSVNYIGLGPFRFTSTKDKEKLSPVLGIEGYQKIINAMNRENISIPVVAIGGIKTEDIGSIIKTGIHGIAVASLINKSEHKKETVNQINKALKEKVNT